MNYLKILVFLIISNATFAQISISSPLNKAVYQRNGLNKHDLVISGAYSFPIVSSIQVRLLQVSNQAVVSGFDWRTIVLNPTLGFFEAKLLNVPAGWYKLEVRALKSGSVLGTASVEKVGIGDVYMIAGQSNAHGFHDWTPPNYNQVGLGSNDERVVSHSYELYCRDEPIPFPSFSQIFDNTKIAPNGKAAWYWGGLGERLVSRTGVPVAFFNAAASGSSTQNWVESIQNLPTMGAFSDSLVCSTREENQGLPYDTVGAPYYNLKRGLNFYNSMFGVKSVLWHQGESDKILGVTTSQYASNLNTIINQTRGDFNPNLPWMIARASYAEYSGSSAIINAQDQVTNPPNKIFTGPYTDWLNNSSYANSRDWLDLHFTRNIGFSHIIEGWEGFIMDSGFMGDAVPIVPNQAPSVEARILSSGEVELSVPSGYNLYKWIRVDQTQNSTYEGTVSVGSTRTLVKNVGTYRCWVQLNNGNLHVSAPIDIQNILNHNSNGNSCSGDVYLSNLKYSKAVNGLGPIEIDRINGGEADGDGASIFLKTIMYEKGLGVAGNSEVVYNLPNNSYYKFKAKAGFSDDVGQACNSNGVIFKVFADGKEIFNSGVIVKSSPVVDIDLGIYGTKSIRLVTEVLSANVCNKFVWAGLELLCNPGDVTPPTNPTTLVISDVLTKCGTLNWGASTDALGVWRYEILKGGIVVDTVSSAVTSYRFKNFNRKDSILVGVRAVDFVGNKSGITSVLLKTYDMKLTYPGLGAYCVGSAIEPLNVVPSGNGAFSLLSGVGGSVNNSTGVFTSSQNGAFSVQYKLSTNEAACFDSVLVNIETIAKPNLPVLVADDYIVNEGQTVKFTASNCQDSNFSWSFSAPDLNIVNHVPVASGVYSVSCKKKNTQCFSDLASVNIKVVPNCSENIILEKGVDNLSNISKKVKFGSSNTIKANNLISPSASIEYNAAKSVILNPGFTVEPGVVFKAEIKNCP